MTGLSLIVIVVAGTCLWSTTERQGGGGASAPRPRHDGTVQAPHERFTRGLADRRRYLRRDEVPS